MVNETLSNCNNIRQNQWTESIAVGSKGFIETVKEKMGVFAIGRKLQESDGVFQLRERMGAYIVNFDSKNDNIEGKNSYYWDVKA